jgi:hypothetical protein
MIKFGVPFLYKWFTKNNYKPFMTNTFCTWCKLVITNHSLTGLKLDANMYFAKLNEWFNAVNILTLTLKKHNAYNLHLKIVLLII